MSKRALTNLRFMLAGSALFVLGLLLFLLNEVFSPFKIFRTPWGDASPISNWVYTMLALSGFPVRARCLICVARILLSSPSLA